MRSIEFTAYAVREYEIKYTCVLNEDDPFVQEMLLNNDITFEELSKMGFEENRGLWDTLMSINATEIDIQEDFAPSEERFIDFDTFLSNTCDIDKEWCDKCSVESIVCLENSCDVCLMTGDTNENQN